MAGSVTDKATDTFNSANPNVARVNATRSIGVTSLSCDDLTGWPVSTISAVHFSTYQIDSSGNLVAGTQTDWKGLVSGNTISSLTRKAGASDSGNAIGDVVEMNPTGSWGHDWFQGFTQEHNQTDGTHKAITSTNATLTTPKIITSINDTNANELFKVTATASAVNEFTVANAATGSGPTLSATGGDTNILADFRGKGNSGVGLELRTQNDNANTINSATTTKVRIQTGWGQILGNGTTSMTDSVTFPSSVTTVLSLSINFIGFKSGGTAAATITEFNTKVGTGFTLEPISITTTGFTAAFTGTGNFGAAYHGYSWTAFCV